MRSGIDISKEKDPYLREIWGMGYDKIIKDDVNQQTLLLRNSDKYIKKIPYYKLTCKPFKIIRVILYSGEEYNWISEADGSCERFREMIKPEIHEVD